MTSIVSIPNSSLTASIIPLLKIVEHDSLVNTKLISPRTILMADLSHRLVRRKMLHNRLYIISNMMCFLGLLGIILMIINNEILFLSISNKDEYICWFIKFLISITTVILVVLVIYYHRLDLDVYAINNSFNHWRIGLTTTKICFTLFEIFICLIHPMPLHFPLISNIKSDNSTISHSILSTDKTLDITLGLPMFARLYLICRCMLFNSHLVRDGISQSIGSLNQVSINFHFLLKTCLQQWPTRCLAIFCLLLFLITSWSLRACSYRFTIEHMSMLDSMWLFIVTFTTVGYGDLIPTTYCGRSVTAITAMIGVLSTALIISVLAQKLQLSRSEKYVHTFILNIKLAKERKYQTTNIIKFIFKIWFLKGKHQSTSNEYIKAERGLVRSMHFNQQLKQQQKKLTDTCIGIPELLLMQRQTNDKTYENTQTLTIIKGKVDKIEQNIAQMNQAIINIQNTLQSLVNRIKQ